MADKRNTGQTIIKRKKVVSGGGHHGGAWKVAYADFVTAMMAFFLLMWLLNATTEKQRKGLADYFSPTIPITRISGGGDGDFGGDSVFSEKALAQNGTGASNRKPTEADAARGSVPGLDAGPAAGADEDDGADRAKIEEALMGLGGESIATSDPLKHIVTRVTDEGLVIEIFDLPGVPLFDDEGAPTPMMVALAGILAEVSALVENPIAIEGHVAAQPIVTNQNTVWRDSVDRAGQVREMVISGGVGDMRVNRVTGHADRELVVLNPLAPRNNRIEFILLRSDT